MARKSFKNGPAAMFIGTEPAQQTDDTGNTDVTQNTDNTHTARRGYRERKSYRYNLLLKPSIVAGIRKIAYIRQASINDLINHVLEDFAGQPESLADIERYDGFFDGKEQ